MFRGVLPFLSSKALSSSGMAKKRFREDLESLFGPNPKPLSLFPEEKKADDSADEATESITVDVPIRRDSPKGSSKGFADSLDAFFSEAFDADPAPEAQPKPTKRRRRPAPSRANRPRGLDMLIQNTTVQQDDPGPAGSHTRRVTLLFNKKHLDKLKAIAQEKEIYLKDIVAEVVEEYLRRKG
jgi:hypothetical protein